MPDDNPPKPAARSRPSLSLAYFVHDLDDPAVSRRLLCLAPALADAVVIGFHRAAQPPGRVASWPAIALGRTADAALTQRAVAVMRAMMGIGRLKPQLTGRTVILSRLLETLPLARAARQRFAPDAALVHECLDIHRLLVAPSLPGAMLRAVERRWLRDCGLVLTSSPAFERHYLKPVHGSGLPPTFLVENQVLAAEIADPTPRRHAGPPWRIGWFGMIRCRRSLAMLEALVRALPGLVEVDIRGRVAASAIPDFDAVVARSPGMRFGGAYDRRHDLPAMYGGVHFCWAIDYFEAGANSDWLLPNRLYEGTLHGAVPIALAAVETGRWLAACQAGIRLGDEPETELRSLFANLDGARYATLAAAIDAIPRDRLVMDEAAALRLAAALTAAAPGAVPAG